MADRILARIPGLDRKSGRQPAAGAFPADADPIAVHPERRRLLVQPGKPCVAVVQRRWNRVFRSHAIVNGQHHGTQPGTDFEVYRIGHLRRSHDVAAAVYVQVAGAGGSLVGRPVQQGAHFRPGATAGMNLFPGDASLRRVAKLRRHAGIVPHQV